MNKKHIFLEDFWNLGLDKSSKFREIKPRQHIWASEIGKNYFDRYMKMTGVKPNIQKDARVLRKFAMGNIIEELVGRMLTQIGFLKSAQEYVTLPENDDRLEVTGKIDYIAGVDDWSDAKRQIDEFYQAKPETSWGITDKISVDLVRELSMKYPEGFADTPLEIKSVNSMLFWAKKDYLEEAYKHHIFQLYTYLVAKDMPVGRIVYISKDDATIKEITVRLDDEKIRAEWESDLKTMSTYYRGQTTPPLPPMIVYDPRGKVRFQKDKVKHIAPGEYKANWEVKFSDYFDVITENKFENNQGIDPTDLWEQSLRPEINALNKTIKEAYIKNNKL